MVNQQLVSYIKRQLSQGYSINSIKLNLARSGYTPAQIAAGIEAAHGKPTRHLAKVLLLVGGGAVVLAALITTLVLLLGGADEVQPAGRLPNKDVGLTVSLDKNILDLGEDLKFEVELINLGSGSDFGVNILNEILDKGEVVISKDESITLRLQETKDYKFDLDLDEGSYQLHTEISFSGGSKEKTINFRVSGGGEEEVVIEEFKELTGEQVKTIENIKLIAETEPGRAKTLCLGLESVLEKDTCLLQTGLKINDAGFCSGINDLEKKDSCYVNVALALKNYGLCNQVSEQNLRDACLALGG